MTDLTRACADCGSDISHLYWRAKRCVNCGGRSKKPRQATCVECGAEFAATRKDTIYCTTACQQRASYRRRTGATKSSERACGVCGVSIAHRHPMARFCEPCAEARRKRPAGPVRIERTCVRCGTPFVAKRVNSLCCSRECNRARLNEIHRVRVQHDPRPCEVCGNDFVPRRSDAKYCSKPCLQKASYSYRRTDNTRPCEVCGEVFKPVRSDAVVCSQRCSGRRRAALRRGEPVGARRYCLACGVDITSRYGTAKFCQECSALRPAAWKEKRRTKKACPRCEKTFLAHDHRQVYCSSKCSGEAARERQLANSWTAACVVCAEIFTTADTRQTTCSTRCRQYSRQHPGYVDVERQCLTCGRVIDKKRRRGVVYCSTRCQRLAGKQSRRGRLANGPVERVALRDIFERDDWTCHLCGGKIDRDLRDHHPMMVSLDHIIPVSDPDYPGHVPENLAAAHLRCNIAKGNRATARDWELYRKLKSLREGATWRPKRPAPRQQPLFDAS